MLAKNCTMGEVEDALMLINRKYDGNVRFKAIGMKGRQVQFTLTVIDSKGKGSRHSTFPNSKGNYNRIAAACWHVHGDFFDALLKINGDAEIKTVVGVINKQGGNWQDKNIGSQVHPMRYSDACDCYEN